MTTTDAEAGLPQLQLTSIATTSCQCEKYTLDLREDVKQELREEIRHKVKHEIRSEVKLSCHAEIEANVRRDLKIILR